MKISHEEAQKIWEAVAKRFEKDTGKKLDSSNIRYDWPEERIDWKSITKHPEEGFLVWELGKNVKVHFYHTHNPWQSLYDKFFLMLPKKVEITIGSMFIYVLKEYGRAYLDPSLRIKFIEPEDLAARESASSYQRWAMHYLLSQRYQQLMDELMFFQQVSFKKRAMDELEIIYYGLYNTRKTTQTNEYRELMYDWISKLRCKNDIFYLQEDYNTIWLTDEKKVCYWV